ncbi:hypothetical protein [Actinacidiphila acididurans]|uniref:Uncharacterized protein n=1 Tax=Actinacidiphila acididurans TaxID=2784346 RepID=A0ABS2TXB9_9ACTN|nr:hypothetical protein [Actinacidiphila acididurans]MBM9507992.1 hypothetical protein [Actinacidiphila acididurans]
MTAAELTTVAVSEETPGNIHLSYPESRVSSCREVVWPRETLFSLIPQLQDYAVLDGVLEIPRPKFTDDGVLVTLEASIAALHGQDDVIDLFSQSLLSIPITRAARWREAVSMALLGGWYDAVADACNGRFGSAELAGYLRGEVRRVHRQLQPLWQHKIGGQHLQLIDMPVADGLSLRDLVSDGSGAEKIVLRAVLDDQRLAAVLGKLAPLEQDVARAWAFGGATTWKEAAERVGVVSPAEFGERVRRKLRRQGREYVRRRTSATDTGLWLPPQAADPTDAQP